MYMNGHSPIPPPNNLPLKDLGASWPRYTHMIAYLK